MHTGIMFAVEAESAEDAVACVENYLDETRMAHWSDWSEHGGRWSTVMEGSVMCYSDDPEHFMNLAHKWADSTQEELTKIITKIGHLSIEELVSDSRYNINWQASDEEREKEKADWDALSKEEQEFRKMDKFALYSASKALKIANHEFTPETHFYDLVDWHDTTRGLEKRVKENPGSQFLVMWDFHL